MKRLQWKSILASLSVVGLLVFAFQNATPTIPTKVIFVSTKGNDKNSGTTAGRPIKTLMRAHEVAAALIKKHSSRVHLQVLIASGTYYGQSQNWSAIPRTGSLRILGASPKVKPLFDGRKDPREKRGDLSNFLYFSTTWAGRTNIEVANLHVRYYLEGISFAGPSRDKISEGITNNVVRNVSFRSIGDLYADVYKITTDDDGDQKKTKRQGLAVIRLVNTKNSKFLGNDFIDINNDEDELQHAFYVAHYSSNNLFEGNYFSNAKSGTTIKLRDYSNDNLIKHNVFEKYDPAAIEIWHCEKNESSKKMRECTKPAGESRSYNTKEVKNIYRDGGAKLSILRERNGNYNKTNVMPAGVYGLIEDTRNRSGYQVRTYRSNIPAYFGICPQSNDCASANGSCFEDGEGSTLLLCSSRTWVTCNSAELGKVRSGKKCSKSKSGVYSWIKAS
ncbi:MAG: hypothetical protein ACAH59_00490 [Pseudobdellovibrionaceae bacterium]